MRKYIITYIFLAASSAQAYDLGSINCGGVFGAINISFSENINNFDQIENKATDMPWIEKKFIDRYRDGKSQTSILQGLKEAWRRRAEAYMGARDIAVPYGSEEFVAQSLVDARIIQKAEYAIGDCGGAEISYFWINKELSGTISEINMFSSMIYENLRLYAGISKTNSEVVFSGKSLSPIEPYFPTVKFKVVMPAEVARGQSNSSWWDSFDVIATVVKEESQRYAVAVFAENIKHAPRSLIRNRPPTKEYFSESSNSYEDEFVVSASIARFFSQSDADCQVEQEGMNAKEVGPFRCTAKWK